MVIEVVNALLRTFILQLLNFLLQLRVKYGFDVLFELASVHKVVSLGNSDNLDGIEKATKLAHRIEYFSEWEDSDGVIHESTLDVIHGDLVEVSNRLTRSLVIIF